MTTYWLACLEREADIATTHVMEVSCGLFEPNFLLREQIIGEARGQRRLAQLVTKLLDELAKKLKEQDVPRSQSESESDN